MIDLKRFRKENKITQLCIADRIGVESARISKFENGKERSAVIETKIIEAFPLVKNYIIDDNRSLSYDDLLQRLEDTEQKLMAKESEEQYLRQSMESAVRTNEILAKLIADLESKK